MNNSPQQVEIDYSKKSKDQHIAEIDRLNDIISNQRDLINNPADQGKIDPKEIFNKPFVCFEPHEIKSIRHILGLSPKEFAKWFGVSDSAVKSWESPRGSAKHAECLGAAGKLMYWAAVVANDLGSAKGNLIRVAMRVK